MTLKTMELKLASLNVRSIKSTARCVNALQYLAKVKADVIFLQECGLPHLRCYRWWSRWWPHGLTVWSGGNDCRASGLGILLRGGNFAITGVREVVGGRLLVVDVMYRGSPLRLINVYASPTQSERLAVLQQLPVLLAMSRQLVLAGDFNCIIDAAGRSGSADSRLDSTSKFLMEMVKDAKLRDAFSDPAGGSQPRFTWSRSDGLARSRIDFVFTTKAVTVRHIDLTPVFFSDHCLLQASCHLQAGRGMWKLNMKLLTPENIEELKRDYACWRTVKPLFDSPTLWWEATKENIKRFFIISSSISFFFHKVHRGSSVMNSLREEDGSVTSLQTDMLRICTSIIQHHLPELPVLDHGGLGGQQAGESGPTTDPRGADWLHPFL